MGAYGVAPFLSVLLSLGMWRCSQICLFQEMKNLRTSCHKNVNNGGRAAGGHTKYKKCHKKYYSKIIIHPVVVSVLLHCHDERYPQRLVCNPKYHLNSKSLFAHRGCLCDDRHGVPQGIHIAAPPVFHLPPF